jgi:histidinol-phosphate aminotransferase
LIRDHPNLLVVQTLSKSRARHPSHTGQTLSAALRERAVLVRHFSGPRVSDFIRITIGSKVELDRLADALAEFLAAPSPS